MKVEEWPFFAYNTKGAALKLTFCEGLLRSGDGWAARPKPRACLRNPPAAVGFAQPSVGREGANPFPARLVIAWAGEVLFAFWPMVPVIVIWRNS